jgi:hypothetical protein
MPLRMEPVNSFIPASVLQGNELLVWGIIAVSACNYGILCIFS